MNNHTPGPWVVADDVVFQVRADDNKMLVAEVRGWGYLTGSGGLALLSDDAERVQKANAQLIAAAPDLLEAAERLIEHYSNDLPDHLVEEFNTAIAKARGAS